MLEKLNLFIDGCILFLIVFVVGAITSGTLIGVYYYIRNTIRNRKARKIEIDLKHKEIAFAMERKTEIIGKQLESFERCAELMALHAELLKDFMFRFPDNISTLEKLADSIELSGGRISKCTAILDKRDRELKEEIANMLYMEKHAGKKPEAYITESMEFLSIPPNLKKKLRNKGYGTVGQVLEWMMKYQRKGLLAMPGIGKTSITALEDNMKKIGLIQMQNNLYFSNVSEKQRE